MEKETAKEKERLKKEMEMHVQNTQNKLVDIAHSRLLSVCNLQNQVDSIYFYIPDNKENYFGK